MSNRSHANVLVFSGLDPTGGAGLQADIETITSIGATACSIVTAVTVQDTTSVQAVHSIDSRFIGQQARCILNDIDIQCFKLGMIAEVEIINELVAIIKANPDIPLVIDPIFSAGGGGDLSNNTVYQQLKSELFPYATIITPNSMEARQLSGQHDLKDCAQYLLDYGCQSVLITGSHEQSIEVCNTLYYQDQQIESNWPRLPDNYHGSGCTLSSSIAAFIALDFELDTAVYKAQQYTYNTLLNAKKKGLGQLIPDRFYATNNSYKK